LPLHENHEEVTLHGLGVRVRSGDHCWLSHGMCRARAGDRTHVPGEVGRPLGSLSVTDCTMAGLRGVLFAAGGSPIQGLPDPSTHSGGGQGGSRLPPGIRGGNGPHGASGCCFGFFEVDIYVVRSRRLMWLDCPGPCLEGSPATASGPRPSGSRLCSPCEVLEGGSS
jgi:hypothetical protein